MEKWDVPERPSQDEGLLLPRKVGKGEQPRGKWKGWNNGVVEVDGKGPWDQL